MLKNITFIKIPPQCVSPKEWGLIRDLIQGEGSVGFMRGNQGYEVDKKLARQFLEKQRKTG